LDLNDFKASFNAKKAPRDMLFLCCVYRARDKRCGEKGVEAFNETKKYLT